MENEIDISCRERMFTKDMSINELHNLFIYFCTCESLKAIVFYSQCMTMGNDTNGYIWGKPE